MIKNKSELETNTIVSIESYIHLQFSHSTTQETAQKKNYISIFNLLLLFYIAIKTF